MFAISLTSLLVADFILLGIVFKGMRKAVKVLLFSNVFYNFSSSFLSPIWAFFVASFGGSIFQATITWATYSVFAGIFMFLLGKYEDKVNKRILFVFGTFLNFIGMTGYFFVSNYLQLMVVQAFLGVAFAVMNPSFNAIYSRSLTKGRENTEWGYWGGTTNFVFAITAVTTGIIVTVFGFTTLFAIMSITAFASLIVASMFMRKKIREEVHMITGKNYSI